MAPSARLVVGRALTWSPVASQCATFSFNFVRSLRPPVCHAAVWLSPLHQALVVIASTPWAGMAGMAGMEDRHCLAFEHRPSRRKQRGLAGSGLSLPAGLNGFQTMSLPSSSDSFFLVPPLCKVPKLVGASKARCSDRCLLPPPCCRGLGAAEITGLTSLLEGGRRFWRGKRDPVVLERGLNIARERHESCEGL